jgi:hypothetical protein
MRYLKYKLVKYFYYTEGTFSAIAMKLKPRLYRIPAASTNLTLKVFKEVISTRVTSLGIVREVLSNTSVTTTVNPVAGNIVARVTVIGVVVVPGTTV